MFVILGYVLGHKVIVCVLYVNNLEGSLKLDTFVNKHKVIPFGPVMDW